jgi:hypothetical protein
LARRSVYEIVGSIIGKILTILFAKDLAGGSFWTDVSEQNYVRAEIFAITWVGVGFVDGGLPHARRPCTAPFPLTTLAMSFSDFYPSDLSDITSSSEEDEPPAKVKKPGRKPKADQKLPYTITQALRPPRSTSYSVRSLYGNPPISFSLYISTQSFPEQIVDGGINLDPDYQRGAHLVPIVWDGI